MEDLRDWMRKESLFKAIDSHINAEDTKVAPNKIRQTINAINLREKMGKKIRKTDKLSQ